MLWYEERLEKKRNSKNPKFSLCCMQGKVELPLLKEPPSPLNEFLKNDDAQSRIVQENIRCLNGMLSFTSMGGKIDSTVNHGRGPYVFKLAGQNYHQIGSLLPTSGSSPKFAQLYIYDTENEVSNRKRAWRFVANLFYALS